MKFSCTLKWLANSNWAVRHTGSSLGMVEVTAPTREAALAKMRDELRYRVELCPCSGVSDDYIELQIKEDSGPASRNPTGRRG
jgi:hypothetical protein